jgi:hypothetical protein
MTSIFFSDELYDPCDGPMPDEPHGYDIKRPDSSVIPEIFIGTWIEKKTQEKVMLEQNKMVFSENSRMEPVVGVFFPRRSNLKSDWPHLIHVITQSMSNGKWLYGLRMLGLSEDGGILTDMESMELRWVRQ